MRSVPASERSQREWWLRTALVLQSPRPVFAALRDDSDAAAEARQEPLAAIVFLAGIGGILQTSVAGRLLDDADFDATLVWVWAVFAGATHGAVMYVVLGGLLYATSYAAGSAGSYRRARHLLGFAAVPIAFSLLLWPVRLAAHGSDAFRDGGSDTGAADAVLDAAFGGALVWSAALVVVGVRIVHGWSWPRALGAAGLPAVLPVIALARGYGLL